MHIIYSNLLNVNFGSLGRIQLEQIQRVFEPADQEPLQIRHAWPTCAPAKIGPFQIRAVATINVEATSTSYSQPLMVGV